MHGEGQGKGRPQEGLIHWLVVAAGCCWAGSTQSAISPLAGPAAGSVSCQIPSALYNPSHDLFRSAAVQSYSPPASSDVSSESTLQYTVVYSTVRPFHCTSPPMPTESLPLGSGQRVPPHCMRVPREVTHRDAHTVRRHSQPEIKNLTFLHAPAVR